MEKNLRTNSLSEIERVLKTRLIHDTHELAKRLELEEIVTPTTEKAAKITPTLFPESLLNRVQKGNAEDPILLQFMPSPHELEITPNFSCDPLCEQKLDVSERQTASSSPSCIMQKYYGRVLVITTNACACQCRFCFRRYFPKSRALSSFKRANHWIKRGRIQRQRPSRQRFRNRQKRRLYKRNYTQRRRSSHPLKQTTKNASSLYRDNNTC